MKSTLQDDASQLMSSKQGTTVKPQLVDEVDIVFESTTIVMTTTTELVGQKQGTTVKPLQ